MIRTVPSFAIRSRDPLPLNTMSERVGFALGCTFQQGEYQQLPALLSETLGMNIVLYKWGELDTRETIQEIFILKGEVTDFAFLSAPNDEPIEIIGTDISQYISDLLAIRQAGQWYIPSLDDIEAEWEYSWKIANYFRGAREDEIREWKISRLPWRGRLIKVANQ